MTRRKWFRMYHGLTGDMTLAVVAQQAGIGRGDMIALWLGLLDHASRHTTPGSIENFATDETALMLGLQPEAVTAALIALRSKKKIDSHHRITGWDKYQPSSTRRVKAWRASRKVVTAATAPTPYEIALAYEALTKGLGAGTSDWSRLPGARNPSAVANAYGRLSGGYMDWARRCQTSGVSHSMIIDILCMGISCSALDRDRRVRKGTARQNLLDGLTLYARLRGWARHPCDR